MPLCKEITITHGFCNYFNVSAYSANSLAVGLARVGTDSQQIAAGSLRQLADSELTLGKPLHSLVLPSEKLHPLEWDMLEIYAIDENWFSENKSRYVKD